MLVRFFVFACELRVRPAPGIPCALSSWRADNLQSSGEIMPREREAMFQAPLLVFRPADSYAQVAARVSAVAGLRRQPTPKNQATEETRCAGRC
jgi:hypothetical protein